jgi:hypothetical protein
VNVEDIQTTRCTQGQYLSGGSFQCEESWQDNVQIHLPFPELRTGQSQFALRVSPSDPEEKPTCVVSPFHGESHNLTGQGFHAEMFMTLGDVQKCLGKTNDQQEIYLASAPRHQINKKNLS